MKSAHPPFLATWMLEHLSLGDRNEALSGDLLEEFKSDRSVGWYWRQVLIAIVTTFLDEIRSHWVIVLFAALSVVPAQAWWFFGFWHAGHSAEVLLPWPYSTTLATAIVVVESLWTGLVVCALMCSFIGKNVTLEGVWRGVWIGPFIFFLLAIPVRVLSHPLGIGKSASEVIKLLIYFLSLVIAAWRVRSSVPKSKAIRS